MGRLLTISNHQWIVSFMIAVLLFWAYAQHIDCSGNEKCSGRIMNCLSNDNHCHVVCIGEDSCVNSTINASLKDLTVTCVGEYSCGLMKIYCPRDAECHLNFNGTGVFAEGRVFSRAGTKLVINATGDDCLFESYINCPIDDIPGELYSNNGMCKVIVAGKNAVSAMKIRSSDSWSSLDLTCANEGNQSCSDYYGDINAQEDIDGYNGPQLLCSSSNDAAYICIDSYGIFYGSVIGDVYDYPNEGYKVACFDINSDNIMCENPTVNVEYEQIDYRFDGYYFNVAYKRFGNRINSEPCKGLTGACGIFKDCPIDIPIDEVWSAHNGPHLFYLINSKEVSAVCEDSPERSINARIQIECNRLQTECQSFEYAWNCMHGLGDCADSEYNGNGQIIFDKGNDINHTIFWHSSENEALIQCTYWCHLTISHLSYSITASSTITVRNGGFLRFKSVYFENNKPLRFIIENNAVIEFLNCSFVSGTIHWQISNNASTVFNECIFRQIQSENNKSMFEVESNSFLNITNCILSDIQSELIWKSSDSFGKILNTSIDCNGTCFEHINGDLFIDQQSANIKMVKLGLSSTFTQNIHAFDFSPDTITNYFVLDNATNLYRFVFEPCTRFNSEYVDQTLFEERANAFAPVHSFNESLDLSEETLFCNQSDLCYVECYKNELACFQTAFKANKSKIALFECSSKNACHESAINVSNAMNVSILCNGIKSCEEMIITASNIFDFALECVQTRSCNQMMVDITNTNNAQIHCYGKHSCDGLRVHSDKNEIKINIHSFSNDILINVPTNYLDDALNCNPNNAYLRLDGITFNNLENATKQLFDDNMPCDDVKYSFHSSENADCIIEYEYFSNSVIDKRLNYLTNNMECFPPIYVSHFTNYVCFGTADPTTNPTTDPTAPSYSPTTAPSLAPTALSDYDAYIDVKYNLFNVHFSDILIMSETNDFAQSWAAMENMFESAYVNHQSNWKLHFYDFYVDMKTMNNLKKEQIVNAHRADLALYETCSYKEPCLLQFECKINCVESVCYYMHQKYDQRSFEIMMTNKFSNYFGNTLVVDALVNEKLRFEVKSMSETRLKNPLKWTERLGWFKNEWTYYLLMGAGISPILCFIFAITYYYKTKSHRERQSKAMHIENPMVLLISIGKYLRETNEARSEIDAHISDLPGIENDVKHMNILFGERFGYDVYPELNENEVRIKWNERDFKDFIEERARYLLINIDDGKKYDSMILIISCHGIPDYLLMSDYRKYSKLAVQRTFSFWPKLREIPRFILYDCCSGDRVRQCTADTKIETGLHQKGIEEKDIFDGTEDDDIWMDDDQNPDHLLARVNAANAGFTSNLNRVTGSYLIYKMYNKYIAALKGKRSSFPFIHEIFDEIQKELQEEGKQLPECVWNDKTRYLMLKKRDVVVENRRIVSKDVTVNCMLEMAGTHKNHQPDVHETNEGNTKPSPKNVVNDDESISMPSSIAMKIMFDSDDDNNESEKDGVEVISNENDSN